MSLGISSALVKDQVKAMQNKHAANLNPAPGGSGSVPKSQAAKLENDAMGKGPAYISPEQAAKMAESMEAKDTSDNWGAA